MTFSVLLNRSGETCDKCKKGMTDAKPGMTITVSDRNGKYHVVWIHLICMQAQINKKWDEANRKLEATLVKP